jgi:hypothetical protein
MRPDSRDCYNDMLIDGIEDSGRVRCDTALETGATAELPTAQRGYDSRHADQC